MKLDPDYAHGPRAPDPTPGVGAWNTIQEVRRLGHMLERKLKLTLLPGEETDFVLLQLDMVVNQAEALVRRHDRNGPAVGNTELEDMQATLRLAAKNPEQFKMFDVKGLKAAVAEKLGVKKK